MRLTFKIVTLSLTSAVLLNALPILSSQALALNKRAARAETCFDVFNPFRPTYRPDITPDEAWKESVKAIQRIQQRVVNKQTIIQGAVTTMIANEFMWIAGGSGGAKTRIATELFKAALNSIPQKAKTDFVIQFHKLINQGVITGFPVLDELLKDGTYKLQTADSLVGDRFLFLLGDEVEKANAETLMALLSVLNERKAYLGAQVVDAMLMSGIFTSNKTLPGFIASFGDDKAAGEALADRMILKVHVPNQSESGHAFHKLYRDVEKERKRAQEDPDEELILHLPTLAELFKKIEIDPEVYIDLAEVAFEFDGQMTARLNQIDIDKRSNPRIDDVFPANQFSTRSMLKVTAFLKAAQISEQLMLGKPLSEVNMRVTRNDLHLLVPNYALTSRARVRPKRYSIDKIKGEDGPAKEPDLKGEWDPYYNVLHVKNPLETTRVSYSYNRKTKEFAIIDDPSEGRVKIDPKGLADRLMALEAANGFKPGEVVEYELDTTLDKLLSSKRLDAKDQVELEMIKKDQADLSILMTTQLKKAPRSVNTSPERLEKFETITIRAARAKRKLRYAGRQAPEVFKRVLFEVGQDAFNELKTKFPGNEQYILALMTGLSAKSHVFAFGPPGGAKSMIARLILDSEAKWVNKEEWAEFTMRFMADLAEKEPKTLARLLAGIRARNPRGYKNFMIQFNKMTPDGIIKGFQDLGLQMKSGRVRWKLDASLISPRTLVAILDEVPNANPAVLSTLLSLLNERKVLAGSEVFKSALITAVQTSNKTPAELKKSFGERNATDFTALHKRSLIKVYVHNKFSSAEELAQFLYDNDQGVKYSLETPLSLAPLREMADRMWYGEAVGLALGNIYAEFRSRNLKQVADSEKALYSKQRYNAYLPPTNGSDSTFVDLVDQFKSRVLLQQMIDGKPYDDVRTEIQLADIPLFFEGLAHWGPGKIITHRTEEGLLKFVADTTELDKLVNSPTTRGIHKEQLVDMTRELHDFVDAANGVITRLVMEYRLAIAQYPYLFPTLFLNEKARKEWIEKHGLDKPLPNQNVRGPE